MTRAVILVACAYVLLCCAQVFGTSCDTVVYRDDFDTSVGGMPDPNIWVVNHPGHCWWVQGRTHFPCPAPWLSTGEFPRVENGVCIIEHHLYNPYDLGTINTTFLGGEIRTTMQFWPGRSYRFEARVRYSPYSPYPNGLVTSFFLYGYDCSNSDEIDFEFVSNKTNDDVNYPNGDPVLTNPWDESSDCPQYVVPCGLDMTEWNTFRIYWHPGVGRVDWTWVDPINGETWLRTEMSAFCVPDEPMALYFNFWAPSEDWPEAYDPNLQPVNDQADNEVCRYEIDYVEVCVISDPDNPCLCGDINRGAGKVDLNDFATFAVCYGLSFPNPAHCDEQAFFCSDLDGNGTVNLDDFATFALLYGCPPSGSPPDCLRSPAARRRAPARQLPTTPSVPINQEAR